MTSRAALIRRFVPMCLAVLLAASGIMAGPASAQIAAGQPQTTATPTARLDSDKAVVDRIESALTRQGLSDATLQQMRTEMDPVAADIQALVTDLSPRLDAAKARLDQLGPKPDAKAPAEAADITAERDTQTKLFNDLDATVKRARVLSVQAGQLSDGIAAQRRALFARSVLERSSSILSPSLWIAVAGDLPADLRALSYLAQDWWSGVASKIGAWRQTVVVTLIAFVLLLFVPLMRLSRRYMRRSPETKPSQLRTALTALWVTVATIVVPSVSIAAIIAILDGADLLTTRLDPIARSIMIGVLVVSTMVGLARGLLAPGRRNWRLVSVANESARRLYSLTIAISTVVAIFEVILALNEAIAVALPTAVATRGLMVLVVSAFMAAALHDIDRIVARLTESAGGQSVTSSWAGPARILGWVLVAVLVGTVLIGYVALGAFLVRQVIYLSGLGALLSLLLLLTDQGVTAAFRSKTRLGRTLLVTAGLHRESLDQFAILLSGALRVALMVAAVVLVLAPWRINSGDMFSSVQAAFFGFSIGDVTISISTIAVSAALFAVGILITRAVQRWLDLKYLPHTHLDTGLRNSIKTSFGYLGVLVALALAAAHLGLSFEKVTYVAGALSVGIGFGLQSVVSNFVSGLIILWERAIRVGDWIVVGSDEGYVRRINVRSTEIETFDRATVVVPNSNLMTGVVKNWVRNDRIGRIRLPITVGLAAKPEDLRTMLIGVAKDHDHILAIPSPTVLFTSYADDKMSFELICFVEDVEAGKRTTSDLLFTIHAKLVEQGIIVAPGPAILTSPVLEQALDAIATERKGGEALRTAVAAQSVS